MSETENIQQNTLIY